MNVVPWLLTAIAIGVAAALFVENRETERQRDALDQQLERAHTAALALEKARAKEEAARKTLESAQQAERAAAWKAEASARRAAAEKDLADRLATEKAALEAQREQIAMERAAAERARQPKVTYITSSEARKKAMGLEAEGRGQEALRIYIAAARSGDCEAAVRLGEIYDKGLVGVTRNYAESLKWYNAARVLGCEVPLPLSRVKPPAVYTD